MLEAAGAGVRPLSTTGIADAAIEHVRDDPVLYYGIVAPVVIPLGIALVYFTDLVTDYRGEPGGYEPRVQLTALAIALLFHARFVAHGALALALERKLRGLDTTVAAAWGTAIRRSLPLGLVGVAFWAAILLGAMFFFVPGIVAFPLLVLGSAVAAIEDKSSVGSVFRAVELGWRETGRALQLAFVLALGTLVVGVGVAFGADGLLELANQLWNADTTYLQALATLSNPIFRMGVVAGTLVLVEPVQALAFALLYVDRRVRTEGFDLKRKVQLIIDAETERRAAASRATEATRDFQGEANPDRAGEGLPVPGGAQPVAAAEAKP